MHYRVTDWAWKSAVWHIWLSWFYAFVTKKHAVRLFMKNKYQMSQVQILSKIIGNLNVTEVLMWRKAEPG